MADINIQPLGDRVLIKENDATEEMKGGIYIPDSAQEKPQEATVVALGTGGKDKDGNTIEFYVKEGDTVFTSKYGGTEIKHGDDEYKIISQSDILAVVK